LLQDKAIAKTPMKTKTTSTGEASVLHPAHPVPINAAYREAYYSSKLEDRLFGIIDHLLDNDPFCDLVFTGHGFGGVLSIIASTRFSLIQQATRVSCHAFGTPKVGGWDLRHLVNSLSNLKMIRLENGVDPNVLQPECDKWQHVGHTLLMEESHSSQPTKTTTTPSKKASGSVNSAGPRVRAFRFDVNRPVTAFMVGGVVPLPSFTHVPASLMGNGKRDHELSSYVRVLEQFSRSSWVNRFVGETKGVVSRMDKEQRFVV